MIRNVTAWICATIAMTATLATASLAFAAAQAGQNAAPQEPGQIILNRACTVCHAITEITKFKGYYTENQWTDVVRTMRADGAQVQDSEAPVLIAYLFKTYGKSNLPDGIGRRQVEESCAGCHDLQTATKPRLTKRGWQDVVNRMVKLGTKLKRGEKPLLVEYLSRNFPASK